MEGYERYYESYLKGYEERFGEQNEEKNEEKNGEKNGERFYKMPKVMTDHDSRFQVLSAEAKFLYMFLLDLLQLSIRNVQLNTRTGKYWQDQHGIFVQYTQRHMADLIHRSLPTVRKRLKELIDIGLIVRIRQGLTRSDKLYVQPATNFPSEEKPNFSSGKQPADQPEAKSDSPNDTKGSTPDLRTGDLILQLPGDPPREPENTSSKPKNTTQQEEIPFSEKHFSGVFDKDHDDGSWNRKISEERIRRRVELSRLSFA
jgi:hypothetical protein